MTDQRHVIGVEWTTQNPSPTLLEGYVQDGPAMVDQLGILTRHAEAFARAVKGEIVPESVQMAVRIEDGAAINRATVVVVAPRSDTRA